MITADMRIARLLDEHPEALPVLLEASPEFRRLKNPVLRRVMAPRVSVADAARIGHVPLSELLARLNAACGFETTAADVGPSQPEPAGDVMPPVLAAVPPERIVELDVRPDIRAGNEPFKRIIAAAKTLGADQVLHLINVFEPIPLYDVLRHRGLAHWTTERDGVWHIYFFPNPAAVVSAGADTPPPQHESAPAAGGTPREILLDVAGLEPPEPMVKILSTLPQLAPGDRLVVHHHREPLMLYDKLAERGYTWETTMLNPEEYRIVIRLASS